jgi:purine-binding chemotaxis protein CheW
MNNTQNQTESYLSFKLGKETFAVHVSKVLEILEIPLITEVPQSPHYMTGVINLRGNVLPVIDSRKKFGMTSTEFTVNTCIAVISVEVNNEQITIGALIDEVQEVMEINKEDIHPSPSIGSKYRSEFIEGMVKIEERFIMILNIDELFSSEEIALVQEAVD